jgi:amino acid transporter
MTTDVTSPAVKMHRALGLRDLVLFNIAAVLGLRWLSVSAQIGPSSLVLWALALLVFFLPLGLTVVEAGSRIPGEGGFYLWTKAAFGDLHAFVSGWSYWVANLVFFPNLLLFGAGVAVYVAGERWVSLGGNAAYNAVFCLAVLWGATLLNIFGLQRAKWLQNIGATATWIIAVAIVLAGIVAWFRFGAATPITATNLKPDFGSFGALATFAMIALAYDGLELGSVLGGEIREPQKTIPRAVIVAGICVALIYIAGTAALLVALPDKHIDLIAGIPQALVSVGDRLGLAWFGVATAALLTLSQLGGLGAWITGTARLPFVVGVDHYLPKPMAKLHPKYTTPYVALLTQATIVTLVLIAALSASSIHQSYLILIDMTLILTFIPLLYIFAALPVLRRRRIGNGEGAIKAIPGGMVGCWLVCGTGFAVTLLALVTSLAPPPHDRHPGLFFFKVGGGCCLLIGIGLVFYWRGRRDLRAQSASSDIVGDS